MINRHPWQIAKLHRLHGQGECAGDERLRGNYRRQRGDQHHRVECPIRCHPIKRILDGVGMDQQQCALAKIIEQKRRQDDDKPGQANRLFTKVTHICIECFATSHDEKDRTEDQEAVPTILHKKVDAIEWVNRC